MNTKQIIYLSFFIVFCHNVCLSQANSAIARAKVLYFGNYEQNFEMAEELYDMGFNKLALKHLKKCEKLNSNVSHLSLMTKCYLFDGNYQEARRVFYKIPNTSEDKVFFEEVFSFFVKEEIERPTSDDIYRAFTYAEERVIEIEEKKRREIAMALERKKAEELRKQKAETNNINKEKEDKSSDDLGADPFTIIIMLLGLWFTYAMFKPRPKCDNCRGRHGYNKYTHKDYPRKKWMSQKCAGEYMRKHPILVQHQITDEHKRSRRISTEVKQIVWARDEGKCQHCASTEDLEFDHIIPFSKGGSNYEANVQLLCFSCNKKKWAHIM